MIDKIWSRIPAGPVRQVGRTRCRWAGWGAQPGPPCLAGLAGHESAIVDARRATGHPRPLTRCPDHRQRRWEDMDRPGAGAASCRWCSQPARRRPRPPRCHAWQRVRFQAGRLMDRGGRKIMVRRGPVELGGGRPASQPEAHHGQEPLARSAASVEPERVTPRIDSVALCPCGSPLVWDEVHGWLHVATGRPGRRPPADHVPRPAVAGFRLVMR
jgi:hypothetical protein